ncbi:hypothetical protein J7E62_06380 [Variovorax paradoxus]|nr:hypothetical protein [Variovorax paradoxus]
MRKPALLAVALAGATVALITACATGPTRQSMSFFVTSAGSGKGADLGGLAGADAHCQRLASAAGAGGKTWRAYLSVPPTMPSGSTPGVAAVNARDRIGTGPWHNAKGELVARDLAHLHNGNSISKATAIDERGNPVKGGGDTPNEHDMLTGSRADGTAFAPQTDTTCGAWTKSGDGSAVVGHHDRAGPMPEAWATSWNFSHQSAGCSHDALIRTGGAGRFYCFAAK